MNAYHGWTINVLVSADGFEFDGRQYSSLTRISHEVTGRTGRDLGSPDSPAGLRRLRVRWIVVVAERIKRCAVYMR